MQASASESLQSLIRSHVASYGILSEGMIGHDKAYFALMTTSHHLNLYGVTCSYFV